MVLVTSGQAEDSLLAGGFSVSEQEHSIYTRLPIVIVLRILEYFIHPIYKNLMD